MYVLTLFLMNTDMLLFTKLAESAGEITLAGNTVPGTGIDVFLPVLFWLPR